VPENPIAVQSRPLIDEPPHCRGPRTGAVTDSTASASNAPHRRWRHCRARRRTYPRPVGGRWLPASDQRGARTFDDHVIERSEQCCRAVVATVGGDSTCRIHRIHSESSRSQRPRVREARSSVTQNRRPSTLARRLLVDGYEPTEVESREERDHPKVSDHAHRAWLEEGPSKGPLPEGRPRWGLWSLYFRSRSPCCAPSCSCSRMYFRTRCSSKPTVLTQYPVAQNFRPIIRRSCRISR